MHTDLAIEAVGLRKLYGRKLALAGLSLEVRRGEAFGLLGPNGAGKSTCLKLLLGLARPTSGEARLLGQPAGEVESRRRVGFLPEHFHFHDWLSGTELLQLHGRLYGMDDGLLRRRVPELLGRVGLEGQGRKTLREYSKGMQQRIGLAQALLHEPDLVFLDEPTSGLDPLGRMLVRDIIREQRARGAAVFLNSHLLGDVEVSCDRVAFVKAGKILATRDLRSQAAGAVRLRVRARGVPAELWRTLGLTPASAGGAAFEMEVAGEEAIPELARALVAGGAEIFEIAPVAVSLEELFLSVIGAVAGEDGGAD